MPSLAMGCMVASAAIMGLLGAVHLLYTFCGQRLWPRDPALRYHMLRDTLGITRDTSVWCAWLGFNASHSLGLLLYAAVFGHLALAHPALLFQSVYLQALGGLVLLSYAVLAWRYWFRAPLAGVVLATACYATALTGARLG